MAHKVFGLTCLYEILGDFVVYRNLAPIDERLPTLADVRGPESTIPRKAEPEYAGVVVEMLRAAHAIDHPDREIDELIYVGDTLQSDGIAFQNLCRAGGWKGWWFIGRDTLADPPGASNIYTYALNAPVTGRFMMGDWNGDGDFDSSDFVLAFETGLYEIEPEANLSQVAAAVDWLFAQESRAPRRPAYIA